MENIEKMTLLDMFIKKFSFWNIGCVSTWD